MVQDKITQFELLLMELNRNISYNEHPQITDNYHLISALYQEILKTNISLEEKNRLYSAIVVAHESIEGMNKPKLNIPKTALMGFGGIVAGIFILKGPKITGRAIFNANNILTPITRFAPALILVAVIVFIILKKRHKK